MKFQRHPHTFFSTVSNFQGFFFFNKNENFDPQIHIELQGVHDSQNKVEHLYFPF